MASSNRRPGRVAQVLAVACVAAVVGSGCSASTENARVQTVTIEKTTPQPSAPSPKNKKPRATTRVTPEFKQCDANIQIRAATTTCEFAQNVFWHYWTDGQSPSLSVYSPAAGATLSTSCGASGARVVCTTADRGLVRFSQAAIDSYSSDQAATYAGTHDLGPDPQTEPEASEPDAGSASPDSGEPGDNIPNYENGRGNRVQCADGMYSKSGGIQGACSGHGGLM